MKQILFLLAATVFFTSCNNTNTTDSTTQTHEPVDFKGNWISKDYLEAIQNNHSPKETAKNLLFYATELVIDPKNGDSVVVYNGQMERASLPFKRIGDTLRLKLNAAPYTDILYSAEDKTIYFLDAELNRKFSFIRADGSWLDKSYEMPIAFPTAVNKATFAGFWDFYEHNSTQKVVEFDKFGNLKGWDKYDSYVVCVNGDCNANESGDLVYFNKKDKSDAYGFYSKGDTISIYNLKLLTDPDEKPSYINGEVLGLLVRKDKKTLGIR
ncbi:MAG: hypothetical protein ACK4NY_04175 [Spirosomataceae bacterium]